MKNKKNLLIYMEEPTKIRKISSRHIISWVIAVPVLFVVIVGIGIYQFSWQGSFIQKVEAVIPYPVAMVDYHLVSVSDFRKRFDAYKQAVVYNQDFDFSDPANADILQEQKTSLLDRMIELKVAEILAKKKGLSVSDSEIQNEFELIAKQSGVNVSDFNIILTNVYGWNEQDFIDQVLIPQLYDKKLRLYLSSDQELNQKAYSRANEVLTKLDQGEKFEDLAEEYSDDSSNNQLGGDLGWAPKGYFVSEFDNVLFALEPGQRSGIVPTEFGLHIIESLEHNVEDGEVVLVHGRHILLAGIDYNDWLNEQKDSATVWKFAVK